MTNIEEIWISIPSRKGYQISNFGNVRTTERTVISKNKNCLHKKRIFKSRILYKLDNGKGYLVVCTQVNKKKKNYYIHRLVAQLFIPNPENKKEVNHKDGNKGNNIVTNLEWVTRSENCLHAYKIGLKLPTSRGSSGRSKLVIDLSSGIYYDSVIDAAEAIGIKAYSLRHQLNPNDRTINRTSLQYA